jgi:hypothetical protein
LLEPDTLDALQEKAAQTLAQLSAGDADKKRIGETPGAIESIVRLLKIGSTEGVQENAASVLKNLAVGNAENRKRIGEMPESIASLVHLLDQCTAEKVNEAAAATLGALAGDPENARRIGEAPGALTGLVRLLDHHGTTVSNGVQETAIVALGNLAGNAENMRRIAEVSGALASVSRLLASGASVRAQEHAVGVLWALAAGRDERQRRIGKVPGVLAGLARIGLLEPGIPAEVQNMALSALWSFHNSENWRQGLRAVPGALAALEKCVNSGTAAAPTASEIFAELQRS